MTIIRTLTRISASVSRAVTIVMTPTVNISVYSTISPQFELVLQCRHIHDISTNIVIFERVSRYKVTTVTRHSLCTLFVCLFVCLFGWLVGWLVG